ncbi:MAG: NEW3 domain-containing protein [Desulfatiglandaceae bacterium]
MTRKVERSFLFSSLFFIVVMVLLISLNSSAFSEEKKKDLPERGISVSPEYTGIVVSEEEGVNIDLIVTNQGRRDENIDIAVTSIPDGWKAWIKTYSFGVTGVHVESDKSKNLTLRAQPGETVGPGKYTIGIRGQTQDKKFVSTSQVTIEVKKKKEEKRPEGIKITTSYPVLQGPTGAKFEFSLEVENRLDKDTIFNLISKGPENWEINFKPAYEQKFISSLRLKADQSQTMAVEVKPYPFAKPGTYPISVKISSADAEGEAVLKVVLTGTYNLEAGTATGLLSLNALRGNKANLSIYVQNTGSAPLNNLHFISFKPENWEVEFNPEKIDTLAPEQLKQVEVSITPTDQALVGDYSVGLRAEGGRVSKTIELRVTVNASSAWGWIGIGIIVFVMAGLVFLFIRLGRR